VVAAIVRWHVIAYSLCCFGANRVEQFAQLYAKKVGVNAAVLQQTLWGDYYLDSKTKTVKKGAQVSLTYC